MSNPDGDSEGRAQPANFPDKCAHMNSLKQAAELGIDL